MPLTRHILYPAVLMPQQGNSKMFHVSFPDIPDCLADGEGIKEAMYHASKALMLALSKQDTVPESSDILIIQHNHPDANVLYIGIDLTDLSQNLKIAMVSKEIFSFRYGWTRSHLSTISICLLLLSKDCTKS